MIRMGLVDTCERAGFFVAEAQDGVDALTLLRLYPSIRLVVTDIDMPRMDGLQLAQSIHRDFRSIRVVLMSGKTYLRAVSFPVEIPFFEKPVDDVALVACLRRLSEHGAAGA